MISSSLSHSNHMAIVLVKTLPSIVDNMALNERHQLVPLISLAIRYSRDPSVRMGLISLLVTISKKPSSSQRKIIIDTLIELTHHMDPDCIEHEILPALCNELSKRSREQKIMIFEMINSLCSKLQPKLILMLLDKLAAILRDDSNIPVKR